MQDDTRYEHWIGAALQALTSTPTNANLTRLAVCYLDAAEYYAVARRLADFYDCIKCVELLSCSSEAIVNRVITFCLRCKAVIDNSEIVDLLFDLVVNSDFENNRALRKRVFEAFHWYSKCWDAYLDFCDWWGFENFEAADFLIVDKRNSLVESAYIAYSRRLVRLTVAEYVFDFYIDFIDNMLAHQLTVYADYHIASFLIRVGFPADTVLRALRRYIKQKHGKVWSWIMLSHLFDEESIEHQACVLFAKECDNTLEGDASTLDYRTICHNLFADIKDADATFWRQVQQELRTMQASGAYTERKQKAEA